MPQKYKDYSLAVRLRVTTGNLITRFANQDQQYYSDQLRNMLMSVFKFKDYEVSVQLMQMLAFGKNKYKNLQLEQLINYLLEKYVGEKGMMKYKKSKNYQYQQEQLMTKAQFLQTIDLGLNFIENRDLNADKQQLQKLFDEIMTNTVKAISQKDYFRFLKEYFGSQSPMSVNPTDHMIQLLSQEILPQQFGYSVRQQPGLETKIEKGVIFNIGDPTGLDQLRDLIISEIRYKCSQLDSDSDQKLTRQQTYTFFYQILLLQKHSIEYILDNYFNFVDKINVGFTQIVQVIGEVHFREILTSLIKQETGIENTNKIILDNQYFNKKILQACFFFRTRPNRALLDRIFKQLVGRSEIVDFNVISLEDFRSYILSFICNKRLIFRQHSRKNTLTPANLPLSIAEVSNSNFEQDSQCNEVRPKQFQLSINECRIQQSALDQRFQSQNKYTPNKISGLSFINRQNQVINPLNQNKIRSQLIIKQSDAKEVQKKDVKTFIDYMLTPQKAKEDKQFFTSFQRQQTNRQENIEEKYQKFNLKQELWNRLDQRVKKYAVDKQKLGIEEATEFMKSQLKFTKKFNDFDKKLLFFFNNRTKASFKAFLSYTVHLLGQQGLFDFSKKQIRGKFTLNEQQLSQIIKIAYGELNNLSIDICLVMAKKLIKQCGKPKFTYSNWLQVVKNKISVY